MAFHEVRFPERLSVGSSGGPERRTEIVTLASGREERNSPWADSRRRYDAGLGLSSLDDLAEVIAFFEARRGQLHGFRWKDWLDWKSCAPSATPSAGDQVLGVGDGESVRFALVKRYASGGVVYARPVRKPVVATLRVAVDGAEVPAEFDGATGEVVLESPPAPGVSVTAGFEFDVPVRFDTDRIVASLTALEAGEIPSIPVVEVRL
mgnify:CR=1 FL=1